MSIARLGRGQGKRKLSNCSTEFRDRQCALEIHEPIAGSNAAGDECAVGRLPIDSCNERITVPVRSRLWRASLAQQLWI
jgi:hypothetical protein